MSYKLKEIQNGLEGAGSVFRKGVFDSAVLKV